MSLEEGVCPHQVLAVKHPVPDSRAVLRCKHARTHEVTHGIVHGIPHHSGNEDEYAGQPDVENSRRRQRACRKKQRVPWQKGCDNQSRFAKNDYKKQSVNPDAVLIYKRLQMGIQMKKKL